MGSERTEGPAPRDAEPDHTLGLEVMSDAVRYRRYLLELINPHCGRTIMEVGSGLGDLADGLKDYDRLVVTDVDPVCLSQLSRRYAGRTKVEVRPFDLREDDGVSTPVDTVLAVNVLRTHPGRRGCPEAHGCRGGPRRDRRPVRAGLPEPLRSARPGGWPRAPVRAEDPALGRPRGPFGRRAAPTRELPRWRGLVGRRPRRRMLRVQRADWCRYARPVRGPAGSPHGATMAPAIRSVDHLCSSGAEPDRLERDRSVGPLTQDLAG